MWQCLNRRLGQHLFLLVVCGLLFLPSLGTANLWDMDEGNYAEAAREMLLSGDWIVPTFNFKIFIDKPPLMYWSQAVSYRLLGVSEFAARLPSALACIASVLLTYELGRRMFSPHTGLLAGLVLASTLAVGVAAQFANPDGILLACALVTMLVFWSSYASGSRNWLWLCGLSTGLGWMTKGPIGLVLPGTAIFLFLMWDGGWRQLLDRRLLLGILLFLMVTAPWHILVGVSTDWEYLRVFYLKHNVQRFQQAFESHSGPVYYYLGVVLVGLGPWVVFLVPTCWFGLGRRACGDGTDPAPNVETATRHDISRYRFLWAWIAVHMVFFSVARTKLPNYVLAVYPALALLIARFLERWRSGALAVPRWLMPGAFVLLAMLALLTLAGCLIAGGVIGLAEFHDRLEGMEWCATAAAALGLAAIMGVRFCTRQRRTAVVVSVTALVVLNLGTALCIANPVFNRHRAPAALVGAIPAAGHPQVRVASYEYFQQSLVFYSGRHVQQLDNVQQLIDFLADSREGYVFLTADAWRAVQAQLPSTVRRLHAVRDFLDRHEILVIGNR
ncbi:MAG: glycosyltransferase family 39 protein [Planctomycetes bacterium]|nr:glycosyltransferase family 39 protein [Planctomycetota bacterium]